MPITPFHFGPGLLAKAALPRAFSFTAFVATEIAVDVETVVHVARRHWPLHDRLHTLPLSLAVGAGLGLALYVAGRLAGRIRGRPLGARLVRRFGAEAIEGELSLAGNLTGGLVGGITASLLDAVMHGDIRPFWPWTDANPLQGIVALGTLHVLCLASGLLGLAVLVIRGRSSRSERMDS